MALSKLPLELLELIAVFIADDVDLAAFANVCGASRTAVNGGQSTVWRGRFELTYDSISGVTSRFWRALYTRRQWQLGQVVRFGSGRTPEEVRCLEVLRDLIVESNAQVDESAGLIRGKNQDQLWRFTTESTDLLSHICKSRRALVTSPTSRLMQVVQVSLSHITLHRRFYTPAQNLGVSQKAVYESVDVSPLFKGHGEDKVNLAWLLHVCNFYKNHLLQHEEATLYHPYHELANDQVPQAGVGTPQTTLAVPGQHWLGSFGEFHPPKPVEAQAADMYRALAFLPLDELEMVRNGPPGNVVVFDHMCQDLDMMRIEPMAAGEREVHKAYLDGIVARQTPSPYIKLKGSYIDEDSPHPIQGRLYAVPPQQGIPGWQRMMLMKYEPDPSFPQDYIHTEVFLYDGVILPGGRIFMGRWTQALPGAEEDRFYGGPFVFWAARRDWRWDGDHLDRAPVVAATAAPGVDQIMEDTDMDLVIDQVMD
ncbi:MAG: hypothetical protein M1838_000793 [Thelocarpon superellum]|nr:MAG: hypothetical protein M1838_000793 [Thelocarpon superellum]